MNSPTKKRTTDSILSQEQGSHPPPIQRTFSSLLRKNSNIFDRTGFPLSNEWLVVNHGFFFFLSSTSVCKLCTTLKCFGPPP